MKNMLREVQSWPAPSVHDFVTGQCVYCRGSSLKRLRSPSPTREGGCRDGRTIGSEGPASGVGSHAGPLAVCQMWVSTAQVD